MTVAGDSRPSKFRLFIDEVGNHDLESSRAESEKYLSLTGVMVELDYLRAIVEPDLESLKASHFPLHAAVPVVLHRREIINRTPPFDGLRDSVAASAFDADLFSLLSSWDYKAITVVIDKAAHLARYRQWANHPYHYCVEILLERFVMELAVRKAVGDVMAESRGANEDRALKSAYRALAENGRARGMRFRDYLTSLELKVQPKSSNVAGLQVADMLAHPAWRAVMNRRNRASLPPTFGGRIGGLLESSKWRRSGGGKIEGYGTKWLP